MAEEPQLVIMRQMIVDGNISHWSRVFEYPWAFWNGRFKKGQWVLDAAGGDSPLQFYITGAGAQVVNIDIDPTRRPPQHKRILMGTGDLRNLDCLQDDMFDRVMCISVLEHIERPLEAVREIWRTLRPGGRFVMTFDVANYARWNHNIDEAVAAEVLGFFHQEMPKCPANVLTATFEEIEPAPHEPKSVDLRVLCFACDKAIG